MIEIKGLKKSFGGLNVLEDITFTIEENDIFGLMGVSGAGKSTLLRCINGLEKFDEGSLKVNGIEVKDIPKNEIRQFRKNIGMIFQHFSLLERDNVYNNIAFPMKCWGYSKSEIEKRVIELAGLVELSDKLSSKPRELSGGQKQRVAIARALSMQPKILLCDEATYALDPNITGSILELLKKINRDLNVTIVVVTHQMEVLKSICNNAVIMSSGRIATSGRVEDIFIDRPPVLYDLLGKSAQRRQSESGVEIEIIRRKDNQNSRGLSELTKETGVVFSLVWGGLDDYGDKLLGSFIINIYEKDRAEVIRFLDAKGIEWRYVHGE